MRINKIILFALTLLACGDVYANEANSVNGSVLCVSPKKKSNPSAVEHKPVKKPILDNIDNCNSSRDANFLSADIYINNAGIDSKNKEGKETSFDNHEFLKFSMEWLLKLFSSIVWPLCIAFVLLAFKKEFSLVIRRLKSVSIPGGGFELHELTEKYEDVGSGVVDETQAAKANLDPRGSIISSWLNLVFTLNELYISKGLHQSTAITGVSRAPIPPLRLVNALRSKGVISESDFEIINDLRIVRNNIAHKIDYELGEDDVVKYVSLSDEMSVKLKNKINT